MQLVIDSRESIFKSYFDESIFKNLDIGDIQYIDEKGNILLIIERKTINDLKQSIIDNRWNEQKLRLLSEMSSNRIIYLIEGNILKKTSIKGGSDTLIGSLINKMLRDNIFVYKTQNVNESVCFIKKLLSKLSKDNSILENTLEPKDIDYGNIKVKKKDNYTPQLWYKQILLNIPQVSNEIADCIITNYPCLKKLMTELEDEKQLENLVYTTSTGKSRRIGPKLSRKIFVYINNE